MKMLAATCLSALLLATVSAETAWAGEPTEAELKEIFSRQMKAIAEAKKDPKLGAQRGLKLNLVAPPPDAAADTATVAPVAPKPAETVALPPPPPPPSVDTQPAAPVEAAEPPAEPSTIETATTPPEPLAESVPVETVTAPKEPPVEAPPVETATTPPEPLPESVPVETVTAPKEPPVEAPPVETVTAPAEAPAEPPAAQTVTTSRPAPVTEREEAPAVAATPAEIPAAPSLDLRAGERAEPQPDQPADSPTVAATPATTPAAPAAAPQPTLAETPASAAPPQAAAVEHWSLPREDQVNVRVNFSFDSAALAPREKTKLRKFCTVMDEVGVHLFRIIGHTDAIGDAAYNQRLSILRAQEVRRFFTDDCKIAPDRLEAIGVGEEFPLDPKRPRAGENRRVEFQAIS